VEVGVDAWRVVAWAGCGAERKVGANRAEDDALRVEKMVLTKDLGILGGGERKFRLVGAVVPEITKFPDLNLGRRTARTRERKLRRKSSDLVGK
jgi:hypothetical protein